MQELCRHRAVEEDGHPLFYGVDGQPKVAGLLRQRLPGVRTGQVVTQGRQLYLVGGYAVDRRQLKGQVPGAGQVVLEPLGQLVDQLFELVEGAIHFTVHF